MGIDQGLVTGLTETQPAHAYPGSSLGVQQLVEAQPVGLGKTTRDTRYRENDGTRLFLFDVNGIVGA